MFTPLAAQRRERHRDELRALILEAAREIFVTDGYESFSMRRLAARIGYSPGSIYLHFRSKEALFEALVEESFARLHRALTRIQDTPRDKDPVSSLRRGLRAYVDFGLRNPNDYRFAFLLRRPLDGRPYRVHPVFDVMRAMVRRCVDEGRFRPVPVERTSQVLWASIHGITALLIQRPAFPWVGKRELVDEIVDGAVDRFVAPRRPPPARKGTPRARRARA